MGQVLRNGYVIGSTLLALPLAALVVWGLLRWRLARGLPRDVALDRSIAEVGAVVGTVPWLVMTMRPGPFGDRRVDLIPVHDLLTMHPTSVMVQIIGNLLVFAAAVLPVAEVPRARLDHPDRAPGRRGFDGDRSAAVGPRFGPGLGRERRAPQLRRGGAGRRPVQAPVLIEVIGFGSYPGATSTRQRTPP